MKFLDFIKQKVFYLVTQLCVLVLTYFGLVSINRQFNLFAMITAVLYLIGCFLPLIIEYNVKKEFYYNLLLIFDNLQRKNLISEMINSPNFIEGIILYDVLKGANKAYLEEINRYKSIQEDYREYIELWVHEIKTPIASSQLIAQNNDDPAMKSIFEELKKIEGYVMQALFYSRSNTVEKDYIVKEISLNQICNDVIKKNSQLFIQNNISIQTENLELPVFCDAKWLSYILTQVIINAIKYAKKENGVINISAKKYENHTVLAVHDNGIGIAAHEVSKIFDKGFVGSNGRQNEKSTGMGLYICKKLCDKLGLSISASSETGQGTTIEIIFPKNSMTDIL